MASSIRIECGICGSRFTATNSRARYCGEACRQRASKNRRKSSKAGAPAEGALVAAVRTELDQAGKSTTVAGQLALTLARQIEGSKSSATGAARELERQLDRALGRTTPTQVAPAAGTGETGPAAPEPDQLDRARQERDAKRRAAAG